MQDGLLTDTKQGNNIYLSVMDGKLVQKVKEGTEGAISRTNKNNEVVHELKYTGLKGFITNIAISDGKFGKDLEIKVKTGSQNFVIQTSASGGYAYGVLTKMVNLDFEKQTEIRPFSIPSEKDKTKNNNFLVLYQDGKKIESAFTRENPNGLPELKTIKDGTGKEILKNGKAVWDDSERITFFEAIIYGEGGINDKLISLYGNTATVKEAEKDTFLEEINEPVITEGEKDLIIEDGNADAIAEIEQTAETKKATTKKAAAKK